MFLGREYFRGKKVIDSTVGLYRKYSLSTPISHFILNKCPTYPLTILEVQNQRIIDSEIHKVSPRPHFEGPELR